MILKMYVIDLISFYIHYVIECCTNKLHCDLNLFRIEIVKMNVHFITAFNKGTT